MHTLSEMLVDKLLELDLISSEKKDNYLYGVEVFIMKILGITIFALIAMLTKTYAETAVFYVTFKSLRAYTNGYHSKYYWACLIESAVVYLFICFIGSPFVMEHMNEFYFITGIAMVVIFIAAPINSESMMFDEEEIATHKKIIRVLLVIDSIFLFIFIQYKVTLAIVSFFEVAIILDAVLLVVEKGKQNVKNCRM